MPRRRIDRISLFRAMPGLTLREDHTFTDPEYNTYACPWHHSVTAALCSFRTAKALKRNPGSGYQINSFLRPIFAKRRIRPVSHIRHQSFADRRILDQFEM